MPKYDEIKINGKPFVRCELGKLHWLYNRHMHINPPSHKDLDEGVVIGEPLNPKTGKIDNDQKGRGWVGVYRR